MRSVDVRDCAMPGKYVFFQAKHFTSLEVRADGTNMWRTTCRRDVGFPDVQLPLLLRAMEAAFQLKELASSPCERGIDALGSTSTSEAAPLPKMEASQWLQLCHNRSQDRARKRVLDDPERKRDIPTENNLIHAGFTASQAQHHITSLQSAFVRERFVHQWEASMPPMIRQIWRHQQSSHWHTHSAAPVELARPDSIIYYAGDLQGRHTGIFLAKDSSPA